MAWFWILLVNTLGGVHSSQRIETLKKKFVTNPAITVAAYKWYIWFLVDWSVHCRLIWDLPSHPVAGSKLERKRSHTCGISMASTFIGYSPLANYCVLFFVVLWHQPIDYSPSANYFVLFLYYIRINFYRLLPSCHLFCTFFLGPESDHWQCLSVTDSLTEWLTDCCLVDLMAANDTNC